jgi:Holliday junction resolvasome RuvABC endonuclease subunit
MIIGIDPGVNNIGIAVLDDKAENVVSTFLWGIQKPQLYGYDKFVADLYDLIKSLKLDKQTALVAIEKPFFTPKTLANNIGTLEVIGLIKYALYGQIKQENLIMLSPASIKKTMTGKGNANKELVIEAVKAKYPTAKDNSIHHIADAIAIAYTAYKKE